MNDTRQLLKEALRVENRLRASRIETSLEVARVIRKLRHQLTGKERAVTKLLSMVDKKDNNLSIRMNKLEQRISRLEESV